MFLSRFMLVISCPEQSTELHESTFYMISIVMTIAACGYCSESPTDAINDLSWDMALPLVFSVSTASLAIGHGRSILGPIYVPTLASKTNVPFDTHGTRGFELANLVYMVALVGSWTARTSYVDYAQMIAFSAAIIMLNGKDIPRFGAPPHDYIPPKFLRDTVVPKTQDDELTLELKMLLKDINEYYVDFDRQSLAYQVVEMPESVRESLADRGEKLCQRHKILENRRRVFNDSIERKSKWWGNSGEQKKWWFTSRAR